MARSNEAHVHHCINREHKRGLNLFQTFFVTSENYDKITKHGGVLTVPKLHQDRNPQRR